MSQPRRRRLLSARVVILGLAILLSIAVSVYVVRRYNVSWGWSYLLGVNLITFSLYAYDKAVARLNRLRVPEMVLHAVTLAGGTPAALVGQNLFQHKISQRAFRVKFWTIVVFQIVAVGLWLVYFRSR